MSFDFASPLRQAACAAEKLRTNGLLAENENSLFAGEANFLHAAILTDQERVVLGFGSALFPAAFGFRKGIAGFLDEHLAAVYEQAVLTGAKFGAAKSRFAGKLNSFGNRFGERGNRQCGGGNQSKSAEPDILFHERETPFDGISVRRTREHCEKQEA